MANDSLARGAKSAVFPPPAQISQKRWDEIWEEPKTPIATMDGNEEIKNEPQGKTPKSS